MSRTTCAHCGRSNRDPGGWCYHCGKPWPLVPALTPSEANALKVEVALVTSHTIVDDEVIETLFGGTPTSQKWEYLFTEFVLTKEGWYLTAINRTMAGKEQLKLRVDEVAGYAGEHGWEMVNSMMTEGPIEKRWKSIMEIVTRDTHESIRVLMLIFKRQKR